MSGPPRYRGFSVSPMVIDKRGKLKPHPFEEAHDNPTPAPNCWYCLRTRTAKIHAARRREPPR
jgi:hypothetical protein